MKKIALVSWFGGCNYGTTLQAFALYVYLSKHFGAVCVIKRKKTFRSYLYNLKLWLKRFIKDFSSLKRIKNINEFIIKNISFSKFEENKFDCVICGSDQIWHPYHTSDFFLLKSFPHTIKKISYASSFGVVEIPSNMCDKYKKAFSDFSALSCREKTGCEMIKKEFDLSCKWVLDPTFLLSASEWIDSTKKFKVSLPKEDYILCYFVGHRKDYDVYVKAIQQKIGVSKIILLQYNPEQSKWGFENITNAGVEDFIQLISRAKYICTDSFHAMAISVNFSKNFSILMRFKIDEQGSQNSRVLDFLSRLSLENRIYNENSFTEKIDYDLVQDKIEEWKNESIQYLKDSINA